MLRIFPSNFRIYSDVVRRPF